MYNDIKDREEYIIVQKEYTNANRLKHVSMVTNAKSYNDTYNYLTSLYKHASEESIVLVDGLYKSVEIDKCELHTDCVEIVKPNGFVILQIVKI